MSKSWRPEGWGNPYGLTERDFDPADWHDKTKLFDSRTLLLTAVRNWEGGADAMLKALKEDGKE